MKRLVHSILELNVKGVVNAAAFHCHETQKYLCLKSINGKGNAITRPERTKEHYKKQWQCRKA